MVITILILFFSNSQIEFLQVLPQRERKKFNQNKSCFFVFPKDILIILNIIINHGKKFHLYIDKKLKHYKSQTVDTANHQQGKLIHMQSSLERAHWDFVCVRAKLCPSPYSYSNNLSFRGGLEKEQQLFKTRAQTCLK